MQVTEVLKVDILDVLSHIKAPSFVNLFHRSMRFRRRIKSYGEKLYETFIVHKLSPYTYPSIK